jgi:hypothetical protein
MRRHILALLSATILALTACDSLLGPKRSVPRLTGQHNVLFVGNSHTYEWDVPRMFRLLAHAMGDTAVRVAEIAEPNYALEDHYAVGVVQSALEQSDWRFVVMQQGTSALPASQVHLEYWSAAFAPLIAAAGATPVMYQIWPMWSRRFDADAALTSYWNAAVAVDGILAPVGDAFTVGLEQTPMVNLYSTDGLHASLYGAYVAAAILLERTYGHQPEALPPTIPSWDTDSVTVRALQRIAAEALTRSPARPTARRQNTGQPREIR